MDDMQFRVTESIKGNMKRMFANLRRHNACWCQNVLWCGILMKFCYAKVWVRLLVQNRTCDGSLGQEIHFLYFLESSVDVIQWCHCNEDLHCYLLWVKLLIQKIQAPGPFFLHIRTLMPAWISNFIHYELWDESTYPFPISTVQPP